MSQAKGYKYDESYPDLLVKHLSQGLSFESFGGTVGVARSTVYKWIDDYPEFCEAKQVGIQKALEFYEKILSAKVSGQDIEGFDPKKSDTSCLIFALKTRFHEIYGDRMKQESTIKADVKVTPAFEIVEYDDYDEDQALS